MTTGSVNWRCVFYTLLVAGLLNLVMTIAVSAILFDGLPGISHVLTAALQEKKNKPLAEAVLNGDVELARSAISRGAEVNGNVWLNGWTYDRMGYMHEHLPGLRERYRTPSGHPMLFYPIVNKDTDMVELLLREGADANASLGPAPLLYYAVSESNRDIIELLLQYGADPARTNNVGMNSVDVCKYYNREDELMDLLVPEENS